MATLPATAQNKPDEGTIDLEVTARRLDVARTTIQPSLGATRYDFSLNTIDAIPQGEKAPLSQVLLRAPGVAQDSFGQVHVRGEDANLQYRLDGVQLPEGVAQFSNVLATQYARDIAFITGAVPAQYGFRHAGIVDITLKSGRSNPGAEASMTAGTREWWQPSATFGGQSGAFDYFATGLFLANNNGIENSSPSYTAVHDNTQQWHALGKVTAIVDENTRLSFIAGGAEAKFLLPTNPGQVPTNTVNGMSLLNSALLDQRQWENTYFGIAALQKHYDTLDFQVAAFGRYSDLYYQPDIIGDLMFNGIAPWSNRTNFAAGLQGDGSWKVASEHTLRSGFLVQREHATSFARAQVLATDPTGMAITDQPSPIVFGSDLVRWLYGIYLQDEWKLSPTVTVNFGARFDGLVGGSGENQISPRLNAVWQPNKYLTAHLGYARYFAPPPLSQVNDAAVSATLGTTAAPALTLNDPVKVERSHYFDGGFSLRPLPGLTVAIDGYYKIVQNLLDLGQFGAPIILIPFNYDTGDAKGVELLGSYDQGPWSVYANLAWQETKARNITSAQFNFAPGDLAFIQNNFIYLDNSQSWTASMGAAYVFNPDSPWATRISADLLYQNGLRRTRANPNDDQVPPYAVVNLSATQKIPLGGTRGTQIRLDVLNLFDNSYQIRDGTGVGAGAPQFGLRRTFLVGLTQKF